MDMNDNFIGKIKNFIEKYDMISKGDTVCCALSGGADSTALLLALKELSGELSFSLKAVHINHMLRGKESDRDETFCISLCKKFRISLKVFRQDAAEFSRKRKMSVETGAREMRYKIFGELSESGFAAKIATAHNLSDNAETVIFRLARGTGLKGLCGIPPVRENFIRPLLNCSRKEIEDFLAEKGESFVTDSTNLSDNYARNRIRHNILPELSALHGGFPENITSMTLSLSEDEDFLSKEAEKFADADLTKLHPALRKRVIINFLVSNNISVNAARVQEIDRAVMRAYETETSVSCDGNRVVSSSRGKLYIKEDLPAETINSLKIEKDGIYPFSSDRIVIISKVIDENINNISVVNKNLTTYVLDCDKIQGGVFLRNRLRSDRIKPVGSDKTRELRKILQERLPKEKRSVSAVLADKDGVFWSECAGIAERVRPDKNTKNFLIIQVSDTTPKGIEK